MISSILKGLFEDLGKTIGKDENSQKANSIQVCMVLDTSKEVLYKNLEECKKILEISLSKYDTKFD